MAINYTTLRAEIETATYATNRNAGADNALADQLNAIVVNNKVNTGLIPSYQFGGLIVGSEYTAKTVSQQNYIQMLMVAPNIDINNANIAAGLSAIFPTGTSRANIIAAQQRDGSRAETLFGAGTFISTDDITKARGSGW
jgi:hypothetical protein